MAKYSKLNKGDRVKNAKDLIVHIKVTKKLELLKLPYGGVDIVVKEKITSGTLRLLVIGTSTGDDGRAMKSFPIDTPVETIAEHIANVVNNMGDPRFTLKRSSVLKQLKD